MKTISKAIILVLMLTIAGCTSATYMQVLEPAQITLPPYIQKIGIINRSLVKKDNQWMNVLEGVLSGESIGADREASEEAMVGLKSMLDQSDRYDVRIPAVSLTNDGIAGSMPSALDWNEVHNICLAHNLDAIIVLESFDSDSRLINSQIMKQVKTKEGVLVDVPEFIAHVDMRARTKWRIYADSTRDIIDMYSSEDLKSFENRGASPQAASSGLPYKRAALNQTGYYAGTQYGVRIAPYWITVQRYYFKKGNDNIEFGSKLAKKNDWTKAAEVWKREVDNPDHKIAGKACFNMAVACEKKGNLELAKQYASDAYNKHNLKRAGNYVTQLQYRNKDNNKLDYQMQGK